MSDRSWYQNGLRFSCTECGNCCTGAPGYVWVNKAEIEALAAHLGRTIPDFTRRCLRKIGFRWSLVELPNYDCIFFDNQTRKCQVYDVRPRQCRTWPFWRSNLNTPESWARTCRTCPGSGTGKLISARKIAQQLAVVNV